MFQFSNIADYHENLKDGSITCRQAVEHYLKNIEANKHLNAFVEVYADEALQRADDLDKKMKSGLPLQKFHGVVIAIKDVICYQNHHVTGASNILKGFQSLYTATALQNLIDEGAIVIGNCNCDEFAMGSTNENSAYGKVLNALNNDYVPGGSSGGSAVVVQADMCMLSLGTDTGGSVRQPADFCGIVGFKPAYGRISRYGLLAYASSFDQVGVFSKNVDDIALAMDLLAKPDAKDSTMLQKESPQFFPLKNNSENPRLCYFTETLEHPGLDPEMKQQMISYFEKLKAEGYSVTPLTFDLLKYIVPTYYVLTTAEASSNLSRYDGVRYGHRSELPADGIDSFYKQNRSEGFGMEVKRRIMLGSFVLSAGYFDAYFTKAQKIRRLLVSKVEEVFQNHDFILMPTSPTTAMKIGQNSADPVATYLADIYTVFANLTGIAGISLPLFLHSNNMPFGLQIMASGTNEVNLLSLSKALIEPKATNGV